MAAGVLERGRRVEAVGPSVALEDGMILCVPAHLRKQQVSTVPCGCGGRDWRLPTPDVCSFWPLWVEALSPLEDMTSLRVLPFARVVLLLRRPRALEPACSECSLSLSDCGSSWVRFGGMAVAMEGGQKVERRALLGLVQYVSGVANGKEEGYIRGGSGRLLCSAGVHSLPPTGPSFARDRPPWSS